MVRRVCAPEQIINRLREVEVLVSQGATAAEASSKIGITAGRNLWMALAIRAEST